MAKKDAIPKLEIVLPASFSKEAAIMIRIVLRATEQGILISQALGDIIAEQLGVSDAEMDRLTDYLEKETLATLERLRYIQRENMPPLV